MSSINDYMTEYNIRTFSLVIFWMEFALSFWIMGRQLQHLSNRQWRPLLLKNYPQYTESIYHLSAIQMRDVLWVDIKIKLITTSVWTVTICSDLIPFMWDSFQLADSNYDFTPNFLPLEIRKDISFGFWFAIFELLVLEFPFRFFHRQLLQAYGLYNRSMLYFVRRRFDETLLKTMHKTLTSFVISFLINVYDEQTLEYHPFTRHLILAGFYMVGLFVVEFFETVITYMDRSTFKPLKSYDKHAELRDKVAAICLRTGYPFDKVYVEEVLPEYPLNAYCVSYFGFYTRIVIIASLIEGHYEDDENTIKHIPGLTTSEIEGIFYHEVGHWVHGHNETNAKFFNMLYEPILLCCAMWIREQKFLFETFHFSVEDTENLPYPLLPGLFIAQQVILRMPDEGVNALWNTVACEMESEADAYAAIMGYGEQLKAGLVRFKLILMGFPSSDRIFTMFYDHHPTLLERIKRINNAIQ